MTDPRWSWLFPLTGLASLILLTRKNRWGHAVGVGKELAWIPYGWATGQYGLVVSGAVFAVLFARGFILWSRPAPAEKVAA